MTTPFRTAPINDGREEDCQCAHCGSSTVYQDCWNCVDGYSHHDCGEDTCCCLDDSYNIRCDICRGDGGWTVCCSDDEWCKANPIAGREDVARGTLEWFDINPAPATPEKAAVGSSLPSPMGQEQE